MSRRHRPSLVGANSWAHEAAVSGGVDFSEDAFVQTHGAFHQSEAVTQLDSPSSTDGLLDNGNPAAFRMSLMRPAPTPRRRSSAVLEDVDEGGEGGEGGGADVTLLSHLRGAADSASPSHHNSSHHSHHSSHNNTQGSHHSDRSSGHGHHYFGKPFHTRHSKGKQLPNKGSVPSSPAPLRAVHQGNVFASQFNISDKETVSRAKRRWRTALHKIKVMQAFHPGNRKMLRHVVTEGAREIAAASITSEHIVVWYKDGEMCAHSRSHCLKLTKRKLDVAEGAKVSHVAVSPNEAWIAVGTSKKEVHVFDLHTLEPRCEAARVHFKPRYLEWSKDGSRLGVGGDDASVRVYEAATLRELVAIGEPHSEDVVAVAFGPTPDLLATGSKDKHSRVFRLTKGDGASLEWELLHELKAERVYALDFHPSPELNTLLVGSDNSTIYMIHITNGRVIHQIKRHTDYVRAVRFFDGGSRFISTGKDGTVRIFDTESGQQTFHLTVARHTVVSMVSMSRDESQFIIGGFDKPATNVEAVVVYNFLDNRNTLDIVGVQAHKKAINDIKFSGDGTMVACASKDKYVRVLDLNRGIVCLSGSHDKNVTSICFTPDSTAVLSGSSDKTVSMLHLITHEQLTIAKFKSGVNSLACTEIGLLLAVGLANGEVHILRMSSETSHWPTIRVIQAHTVAINEVTISSDGKMLGTAADEPTAKVFDLQTGRQRCFISSHSKEVYAIRFSPDSLLVATGSRDKRIFLSDVSTGHAVHSLPAQHTDHVKSVAFSGDGCFATGSMDSSVKLFDASLNYETTGFASRFRVFHAEILCLDFAPPGPYHGLLAIGNISGTIHFVDTSLFDQQPTFAEAVKVISFDRFRDSFSLTEAMVKRFPFAVNSTDASGGTLFHYAVSREDHQMLGVLLRADQPKFFLPANKNGHDPLHTAAQTRSRQCIQLLLTHLVKSKQEGRLAPLPTHRNRFLRDVLKLTPEFHDLVATFLRDYGLDDAPTQVVSSTHTLRVRQGMRTVAGSAERAPKKFWQGGKHKVRSIINSWLSKNQTAPLRFVTAQYIGIPWIAGILPAVEASVHAPLGSGFTIDEHDIDVTNSVLHQFVKANNAQLFGNAIMKRVLQFKWESYARALFLKELMLFAVYSVMFIALTLLLARLPEGGNRHRIHIDGRVCSDCSEGSQPGVAIAALILSVLVPPFAARIVYREFQQLKQYEGSYVSRFFVHLQDVWSFLQISASFLTTITCALHLFRAARVKPVAAIAALALWFQALYFLRAFKMFGGLVRMIVKVLFLSGPFLIVLLIVLLGATNAFYLLFSDLPPTSDSAQPFIATHEIYDTWFSTFTTLLLGEFEQPLGLIAAEENPHERLLKALFVLLSVVITIFMLNLMINLMDDFMAQINEEEGDAFPYEQARIIAELEQSMSASYLSSQMGLNFPKWLHVLSPKTDGKGGTVGGDREWNGAISAIGQQNQRIVSKISDDIGALGSHVEQIVETFETRLENSRKQDAASLKHMMDERLNQLQQNVHDTRQAEVVELKSLIEHLGRAISRLDNRVSRGGTLQPSRRSSDEDPLTHSQLFAPRERHRPPPLPRPDDEEEDGDAAGGGGGGGDSGGTAYAFDPDSSFV